MTCREAFDAVTGIAEQYAAGTVAIHQHGHQFFCRRFIALIGSAQQAVDIFIADAFAQQSQRFGRQRLLIEQQGDRIGHWLVLLLFGDKFFVIVKAVGIEQTQAGKVAFLAELFRGCGQ